MFTSLPEPWGTVLSLIVGPVGAFVALCIAIFFLWRLYREEQAENRENFHTVALQSKAIEALTTELHAGRELTERLLAAIRE
jgi:flagellar basal body-associated protein FliL